MTDYSTEHDPLSISGWDFDPVALVRTVNWVLETPSSDRAIALRSLTQNGNGLDRLLTVLLLAVVIPRDERFDRLFGRPDFELPDNDPEFPLVPLVLCDELPFLLAGGFRRGGALPAPTDLIERWTRFPWRTEALHPQSPPHDALNGFLKSDRWGRLANRQANSQTVDRLEAILGGQVIRALGPHAPKYSEGHRLGEPSPDDLRRAWNLVATDTTMPNLVWSELEQRFVPDRSTGN